MSTTVSVMCYKSKTLKNGEHPLMLCVTKDRKRKYQSLGISVKSEYWDFSKNKPKPNCPNKELILKIILEKEIGLQKQVLELKAEDKEFTASTLITPKAKVKIKSVKEFYLELIKEFEQADKVGNSRVYHDSLRSLEAYTNGKLDIPFSHVDIDFLNGYEKWLKQRKCKETSISICFRTLRSVYNKAIDAKFAKKTNYPFDDFKVAKFNVKTEKRAIPKDNIKLIMEWDLSKENEEVQFARDVFVFSYLCSGINFTDMANLQPDNIVEGRLIYKRQKTGKNINILLSNEANAIIQKYTSNDLDRGYIFPILHQDIHETETQKYNRKKKALLKVNRGLKEIAKITGIKANITTSSQDIPIILSD